MREAGKGLQVPTSWDELKQCAPSDDARGHITIAERAARRSYARITTYGVHHFPSLLQTPDYAASLLPDSDMPDDVMMSRFRQAVASQIGRAELINKGSAPRVCYVGQSALRNCTTLTPEILKGQLASTIESARSDLGLFVRVMPSQAQAIVPREGHIWYDCGDTIGFSGASQSDTHRFMDHAYRTVPQFLLRLELLEAMHEQSLPVPQSIAAMEEALAELDA